MLLFLDSFIYRFETRKKNESFIIFVELILL